MSNSKKITAEELKELLGIKALNDDELEMVTGGGVLVKTYTDEDGQECSHTSALRQRSVAVD